MKNVLLVLFVQAICIGGCGRGNGTSTVDGGAHDDGAASNNNSGLPVATYCRTQPIGLLFCSDFDEQQQLGAGWSRLLTVNGEGRLDAVQSTSLPNSFSSLVHDPPTSNVHNENLSVLTASFTQPTLSPKHFHLEFDLKWASASTPQLVTTYVAVIALPSHDAFALGFDGSQRPFLTHVGVRPDGTFDDSSALGTELDPWTPGPWTRIGLDLVLSNDPAQSASFFAFFDGVKDSHTIAYAPTQTAGATNIYLGAHSFPYNGVAADVQLYFDNVTFDMQ